MAGERRHAGASSVVADLGVGWGGVGSAVSRLETSPQPPSRGLVSGFPC